MELEEKTTTRLWLEEYKNQPTIPSEEPHYESIRLSLSKEQIQTFNRHLKKNKINWSQILHAAWGLLLNRFSSSDFITFGSGEILLNKKTYIKTNYLTPIASIINEKISKETLLKKNHLSVKTKEKA